MGRAIFSVALAFGLVVGGAAWAVDATLPAAENQFPTAGQYIVQIKMLRTGNDGTKTVLAEPTLVVPANRPASFLSGGYMPAADEEVPIGTSAKLTVRPAGEGKALIVGMFEISEVAERGEGILSRHCDQAYFKQVLSLDKTKRILLSSTPDATQWIELTVSAGTDSVAAKPSKSVDR